MKFLAFLFFISTHYFIIAQPQRDSIIKVDWPINNLEKATLTLDLADNKSLIKSIAWNGKKILVDINPAFILTIGKRDLVSQNGWNIFFDKVPNKPHQSYPVSLRKKSAKVRKDGMRTIVSIGELSAEEFSGTLEITLYHGSPLINIAAVMSTKKDSVAILYDAGITGTSTSWKKISWSDTEKKWQSAKPTLDTAMPLAVKYRTIIGENSQGSIAIFPPPHQYFYPLDEAFNLKFCWYGKDYRDMMPGFGIGIRQELEGDKRYVPWFNAPPGSNQRLNFFLLLGQNDAADLLKEVKKYTHADSYKKLNGYKTMASHFHNEFIMNVVMKGESVPEKPEFINAFKEAGLDMVHLGEFHYTAHPKGPDLQRLQELHALFQQCKRLSDNHFLLMPGEEPNEFYGGHWMALFPKPVNWIMSRNADQPFVSTDSMYGKTYRIGNKEEMMKLLEVEKGLAWTAHARTKGSKDHPDFYKTEDFFASETFMGAAWKPMPADLSLPLLGKRVLDLMDDMNNWGLKKHVIGEADLFTVKKGNEMYAHLNVNYLQLNMLPKFETGWQSVLDAIRKGKFFTSTGEVLLPSFKVNGKGSGEVVQLANNGTTTIELEIDWTFPLNYAEIISGNGKDVFREKIILNKTGSFGKQKFSWKTKLSGKKWVRLEVWDVAANGAFTQTVFLTTMPSVN